MKKLFTSTLLTVAAVPFLMAAPHAAKKVQNQAAPAAQNTATTAKTKVKKHTKKAKKSATGTSSTESSTSAPASK